MSRPPEEAPGGEEMRRGVHEAAIATIAPFRAALGQAYVSYAEARAAPFVLDGDRARTLTAWIDGLVPGDENWPRGSETDAAGYIDATIAKAPALRPLVLRAIDLLSARAASRFGAAFDELAFANRHQLLAELEAEGAGGAFELVLELTFEAYYRDERVLGALERRTGFSMKRATQGWEMEPFDERLLDRVRALPRRCRDASG